MNEKDKQAAWIISYDKDTAHEKLFPFIEKKHSGFKKLDLS